MTPKAASMHEPHVGLQTMNCGRAFKLLSLADTDAVYDYWWCQALFVDVPAVELVKFKHGSHYRGLHG